MLKKNLKYYSLDLDEISLNIIKDICEDYSNIKNYFFSRYSGIKSFEIIQYHRGDIRDVLIKDINENKIKFNLPSRFWKLALDECVSNIKSNWSNCFNKVKININNNESFNDIEKHYLRYYLKTKHELLCILTCKEFVISDKFKKINSDRIKYLNKYLRRTIRKNKSNISKIKNKNGFSLDTEMYVCKSNQLYIQTKLKGNRLPIELNVNFQFNKTIQIRLLENKNKISVSQCIETKIKEKLNCEENIIGIDKNYENVIASSNDMVYGNDVNKLYNKYTDVINSKYKNRNKINAILKKYKKEGNQTKIDNIIKNNLGSKSINNKKRKIKDNFKSVINNSLNEFIEQEKPTTVVVEDLKFQTKSNKKKKRSKKTTHKLSSWCKGYIQERIDYKCKQNNINIIEVNAAYTSQQCPHCLLFLEERTDTGIVHCPLCGKGLSAHTASAKIILNRSKDKRITLRTKPSEVKKILLEQNKALLDNYIVKTGATLALDASSNEAATQCTDYQDSYNIL